MKISKELEKKASQYQALGHPARLAIVEMISNEPLRVIDIQKKLKIAQSSVSQHLEKLRRAGVVRSYRKSTEIFNIVDGVY